MNFKLLQGDCLTVLRTLPAASVHCCVTSPPYFGLRDYDDDGQIGLERTPSEYVAKLVDVFREVWRVLRCDGTLWLNLGDSYASAWAVSRRNVIGNGSLEDGTRKNRPNRLVEGLKEKDLIGIPWRVAFALQADGWYLRSDIVWAKPNVMPENVTDRPTKAHEYLFLLTKRKRYYYDAQAIAEKASFTGGRTWDERKADGEPMRYGLASAAAVGAVGGFTTGATRNKRTVWTIATQPYAEAHYATYPVELVQPCIMAGSPAGGAVLDPFNGSGTTGVAAIGLGRDYIGIEINPEYIKLAQERLGNTQPALIAV